MAHRSGSFVYSEGSKKDSEQSESSSSSSSSGTRKGLEGRVVTGTRGMCCALIRINDYHCSQLQKFLYLRGRTGSYIYITLGRTLRHARLIIDVTRVACNL